MTRRRFVVLWHEAGPKSERPSHWDFMVEDGDGLATWAMDQSPDSLEQRAHQLDPHRKEYLEYEGPVSNERGMVRRWDWGECDVFEGDEGSLRLELRGQRLQGEMTFTPADSSWGVHFARRCSGAGK